MDVKCATSARNPDWLGAKKRARAPRCPLSGSCPRWSEGPPGGTLLHCRIPLIFPSAKTQFAHQAPFLTDNFKHQSIIMAFSILSVRSPFVAGTRALAPRRISAVRAPVVQRRSFVVRAVSIPHRFKFSLWHHLALTAGTGRCIGRRPQHPLP